MADGKPRLTIFALNEDGLYSDFKSKKLIVNPKNHISKKYKILKPQLFERGTKKIPQRNP